MAYPNQNSEEGPCLSQQLFSSFCIPLVQIGTIVCLLVIATVWPLKAAAKNLPPSAVESVQDFFDQVGHKTMYASSGNNHFFTKYCHCQTYQNYDQPPQTSQNSDFQSHFSVLKLIKSFQKNYLKNIGLGDQLLIQNVSKNVPNFSLALFIILVGLMVALYSEKMLISTRCILTWFHVQL